MPKWKINAMASLNGLFICLHCGTKKASSYFLCFYSILYSIVSAISKWIIIWKTSPCRSVKSTSRIPESVVIDALFAETKTLTGTEQLHMYLPYLPNFFPIPFSHRIYASVFREMTLSQFFSLPTAFDKRS